MANEVVGGRYRLSMLLKVDSGVETHLAEAVDSDERVVVKRAPLASVGTALALRLDREAGALVRSGQELALAHGVDGGWWWLAQRFVPGTTLAARLARGALSVDETLLVASDTLRTLCRAHDGGVLHRDIKPANVVVSGEPAVTHAALVDFGLSRGVWRSTAVEESARYLSPEQSGLLDAVVDERSDLYSLGAVLFECLAGRPLFDGASVRDILRQHLSAPMPDVSRVGFDVPRVLGEVIDRLLRRSPDERYQSATGVLADVDAIRLARTEGRSERVSVIGSQDRRQSLAEPGFVGRGAELGALIAAIDETARGEGGVILLEGESGGGKSRLIEELARAALARGVLVLRGQGEDQSAPRPFELFDGVARGLVGAAERDPVLAGSLRDTLPADAVVAASPPLAALFPHVDIPTLPDQFGQARTVAALVAVLDACGGTGRPALVVLDDCQWAERDAAHVLADWSKGERERSTLVVAAFRSEEVGAVSPLRALTTKAAVRVGAMGENEVRELIASMAGPVPPEAATTVVKMAAGSPFMAQAVVRGMVETGALRPGEEGWRVDAEALRAVELSRRAALFLLRRLDLLSAPAQLLLAAAAILGKQFDLQRAVVVADLPPTDAAEALDECRRRRILWVEEADDRARFGHDKLREAVLARLDDDERRALHLRAARLIQGHDDPSPFELAFHLDAAGHADEALAPALQAAEQARERHALEAAELYYRVAARANPDDDTRVRVAEGLGEVLSLAGRYDEAEAQLIEATRLTADRRRRAALEGKLGEVAFRRGDQGQAASRLEGALRQLGRWVPRHKVGFLIGAVWELVVQIGHTAAPKLFTGRRRRPATEEEQLAMRFYSRLAYAYWFRNGKVLCGWAHLREMNLAERFGPSLELAQAYSEHAPVMTMLPWWSRGISYARRSLAIRTELGDVWGQGQSLNFYGVVLYAASRYQECLDACERAVDILGRTGDRWEINTARWHIAFAHYRLGHMEEAARVAAELHRDATAIGDQSSAGIALSAWARSTAGDVPEDVVAAALARNDEDVHTATEVRLAEALRQLRLGEPSKATALLAEATAKVQASGLRQEYVTPVWPWYATALRHQLDHDGVTRAGIRKARRTARRAARLARSYQNNLPHALRERGLIEARAGRPNKARRLLDQSIVVATEQGAEWEEAESRYQRARLGVVLAWPGAAAELETVRPGEEQTPAEATLSLADRFAGLLDSGRAIAAATTPDAIFAAALEAARIILRTDACQLVDPGQLDPEADPLLSSVVAHARDAGGPVSFTAAYTSASGASLGASGASLGAWPGGATGGELADRLLLAGLGRVVCAPIVADGRPIAFLYAAQTGPGGEDDVTLAEYIATLAGAALEHAEGSAAHFRALVQNASDVTIVCDADRSVRYVSPTVTRILGYSPDHVVTSIGFGFVHPSDHGSLAEAFNASLAGGRGARSIEVRGTDSDGSLRLLEVTLTNLCDDPSVGGVVINVRDTTDRRLAELGQAQAAEQFRVAFDNAPVGMAFTSMRADSRGRFLRVNQALADMLGYAKHELEGLSVLDITHPDDAHADAAAMSRFQVGAASTFETEKRYRHVDGHYIWVHLRAALMTDERGESDYAISQMVDITERREAEAQLESQALHDPLTGLPNRRKLVERMTQALEGEADRVAVLYLDLDQFKVINDSYGHDIGDQVLISVAHRLARLLTDRTTLARLGGDEFVVLIEGPGAGEDADALARTIHEAFEQPLAVNPRLSLSLTTSIGVALGKPGKDGRSLLRDADTALYRAKELGRARHEVFGEGLHRRAVERMRAERDLRAAIDDERLVLHYQPIIGLEDGGVVGMEALIRYRQPGGHIVAPGRFIEVAEQTGLIVPLGAWALGEACRQFADWRAQGVAVPRRVTVNASPRQLRLPGFVDTVVAALDAAQLEPDSLALEITEMALIDSIETALPAITRLRSLGCAIGIDDFGTGYASFTYLRKLPVDFLKIDRSFISGLGSNQDDTAIVGTLVGLAQALNLAAIAEGVETEEQEHRLRDLGCLWAQGYRFARPAPAEKLFGGSSQAATGASA